MCHFFRELPRVGNGSFLFLSSILIVVDICVTFIMFFGLRASHGMCLPTLPEYPSNTLSHDRQNQLFLAALASSVDSSSLLRLVKTTDSFLSRYSRLFLVSSRSAFLLKYSLISSNFYCSCPIYWSFVFLLAIFFSKSLIAPTSSVLKSWILLVYYFFISSIFFFKTSIEDLSTSSSLLTVFESVGSVFIRLFL